MKRAAYLFIALLCIGFVVLQINAARRDYVNPPVVSQPMWPSAYAEGLARRACFDCHSNETQWPWYAYTWPMGATVEYDVRKGRELLNFSEWTDDCCPTALVEQMAIVVNNGQMPLPHYLALHPEAQLTYVERGVLTNALLDMMTDDYE